MIINGLVGPSTFYTALSIVRFDATFTCLPSARAPPNTTFYFDLTDTSTGQRISSLLQLHINGDYAEGLSSCTVNYEGVTTPTAGQQLAGSTSTLVASSAYIDPSSLSSSTAYNSAIPTSSTEADGEASTSTPTHSSKVEKGLSAGVALLALALIGMLFMQYRLRKRLARLQKGQSTVGRWMNHHHQQRRGNEQHNLDYTRDNGESTLSHESQSGSKMKLMSSSSNVYATSDSSNGRLSSFFERESACRAGASGLLEDQNTSTRRLSSSIIRPSSSTISPISPSISNDPFADSTEDEDDDDESIHRSASQQKRYSQAESAISDSTTRTSATGRTITSSIAPSEGQLSSVGNVSVVSDEYYHRSKACTITPGASLERKAGQFLEPHLALLDSRR